MFCLLNRIPKISSLNAGSLPKTLQHIVLKVKTPGMNAHKQSYRAHVCYQCGPAVGQERERNSGDRHYAHDHTDVQAEMVKVHAEDAGDYQNPEPVAVLPHDGKAT